MILANAVPVLAEVDESLTIDPTKIEQLITPRTRAIIPVHMLGNPCDMDPILEIAKKHGLYVIEDCCQAVGASYKGKRLGTIGIWAPILKRVQNHYDRRRRLCGHVGRRPL